MVFIMGITWRSTSCYFHSYPVALNFWKTEPSNSSAIIKLFIQDNFCEFVNPVTVVSPLILPPSTTLLFSCAYHMNWSPSSAVITEPCQEASIMPCGYLVIIPEPRFSPLGNLPSPLISEVKLTYVVTPSIG
jgi:hypothetical protein